MPKSELIKLQEKKLRQLVAYVKDHSKIYRRKFKETKINTDDIKTLDDLHKLPFTIKKDFRDNYPIGMLCVPDDQVIRYHASSGTTGKRTIVGYTRNDIHEWSTSLARGLTSLGVGRSDIIQNSYGYGLFTGGLGFHYGAEMVGATTLPTGAGMTERQLELMQDLGTTAFACTPSYFLHIAEVARNLGIDFSRDTKLKVGLFGAEPWSEDMRKRIEESTGINAYDVFGTSELNGPLFMECKYKNGIHIWADQYIVEIINPETGEPVSEGKKGELVVTTISKEAMPLIRYKIGDITYINSDECECGRTHPRLMRILGRADDMLIIRGINVFPGQIESVLMKIPELSENYQLVIDREHELDEMTIIVEIAEKFSKETKPRLLKIRQDVINDLRNVLNLSVKVKLEKPGSLPRSLGKAKRVIDNRKI
ncbi:phenylacetate--CoA ligase [miscellaneous Crenarchaeota group archaeon SMTZ-80]|nr:MAG: phenylacetate--CoA ligase [miscellaneous Crenarchaeota group archaeon SMTZ-80]